MIQARTFLRRLSLWLALIQVFSAFARAETQVGLNIRGKTQQLHLYGTAGNPAVIVSSGDLGWTGSAKHVAELLANHGYFVIGFSTHAYLTSFTSRESSLKPQDVPGDYLLLVDYARQAKPSGVAPQLSHANPAHDAKPILLGISEGAGLSVLAATDPVVKRAVGGVLGLGLPNQTELGWRWQDFTSWITKHAPDEPSFKVADVIAHVSPVPLVEIHSTHDEFLPIEQARQLFARAGEPKRMWVIEAPNHRFSGKDDEVDRRTLEALAWLASMN